MDNKNTLIGVALLAAALLLMFFGPRPETPPEPDPPSRLTEEGTGEEPGISPASASANDGTPADPAATGTEDGGTEGASSGLDAWTRDTEPALTNDAPEFEEELVTLENGIIRVTFTTAGGAIKYVDFIAKRNDRLAYPQTNGGDEPYRFNRGAPIPALAISLDRNDDGRPEEFAPEYRILNQSAEDRFIVFGYDDPVTGMRIVRSYELQPPESETDPYVISHDTKVINRAEQARRPRLFMNVGTAPPTKGDERDEFLNFGYAIGDDTEFIRRGEFDASGGFLGIGSRQRREFISESWPQPLLTWAAVKNQFFTSVLTPAKVQGESRARLPGVGYFTRPVDLTGSITEDFGRATGITGSMAFDFGTMPPQEEKLLRTTFYVGPKEYFRLDSLAGSQGEIMQFGYMGLVSKFLLLCLHGLHNVLVFITGPWAWGFAIVALTIIIKAILWPLTRIQVRSAKRMAELQGPMKELQEKYKDDPEGRQKATMKLFQDHKVNPAAGCLPILVQMPIFIGLFFMLRTSSELRFAPFLWINDLSVPDTLFSIGPLPFNLLPLAMVAAQVMQMRLTPSPSADPSQKAIMQFMPVIFLVICYNFPSGVVLYWTVQTALGIVQQLVTNRIKDEEDIKIEAELAEEAKHKRKHVAAAKKTTQQTKTAKKKRKR
ncbi:MAG: YidC/Oxa1 family insertase periplasmic-domain containing protein [Opitutales bacterium]